MEELLKERTRGIVEQYFSEEDPQRVEELNVVFEDVWATLERMEAAGPSGDEVEGKKEDGIGFDYAVLHGAVVAVACWVTLTFLKAAFKDSLIRDILPRLRALEPRLARLTGMPELVHKILVRVEGIISST